MNTSVSMNIFEPRELAFLKKVFDDVCIERGLVGGSAAATRLAAEMIELYQRGVKDETTLHRHFDRGVYFG